MSNELTWADFKAQMEVAGVKDKDVIWMVDLGGWFGKKLRPRFDEDVKGWYMFGE